MKPIRDYNDGQWLLLLWAFIIVFVVTGVAISTPVLIVSILAALGAAYTTFLYVREQIGRRPSRPSPSDPESTNADTNEGGTP